MSEKTVYWADAVLYPLAIIVCAALTLRSLSWFMWFAAGFVLFTFAEYWIHRSILHRWFYHGAHEQHHLHPEG